MANPIKPKYEKGQILDWMLPSRRQPIRVQVLYINGNYDPPTYQVGAVENRDVGYPWVDERDLQLVEDESVKDESLQELHKWLSI